MFQKSKHFVFKQFSWRIDPCRVKVKAIFPETSFGAYQLIHALYFVLIYIALASKDFKDDTDIN